MASSRRANGSLELGGVVLAELVGRSPAYVYDLDAMAAEAKELDAAFEGAPHRIFYAVKANSAGAIVKTLAAEGCGADVVTGGELLLALGCGIAPDAIVYSGVAKTDAELDLAIEKQIAAIQAESVEEVVRIAARARGRKVKISLRVNPGVDAEDLDTHKGIATGHDDAKFGVPVDSLNDALAASKGLDLVGLAAHVGSQFTNTDAYLASSKSLFDMAKAIRDRFALSFVDTGGGFGIDYGTGNVARPAEFVRRTRALQREMGLGDLSLHIEPGRCLVGAHSVLVTKVIQRKVASTRRWMMIDAGMNDLMRPALYQARHRIVSLGGETDVLPYRVVGPVCESSDDFGIHDLPSSATALGILDAGAYGYSMASRYNGRPLPSEIFLRGGRIASENRQAPVDEWVKDRLSAGA